jgi:hypothetical protein
MLMMLIARAKGTKSESDIDFLERPLHFERYSIKQPKPALASPGPEADEAVDNIICSGIDVFVSL